MIEPESSDSNPESKVAVSPPKGEPAAEVQEEAAAPGPEPWTPARVTEWNAYYDLYVVLGVLLLAFVASANRISSGDSLIWTHLKAGELMAAKKGAPLLTDPFSYTETGKPWINVPWLFELGQALIYKGAYSIVPPDANDPISPTRKPEQVGAGVLVGVNALVRLLTVLLLLAIRRPGPGLWWACVCAMVALGVTASPSGPLLGGLAGPAHLESSTWGQLLFALELVLLHRAIVLGRRGAALGLIPLFVLWANVDVSFVIGLFVLAATVLGRLAPAREELPSGLSFAGALGLLVTCAAACLVNPSLHRAYLVAIAPILRPFHAGGEQVSLLVHLVRPGAADSTSAAVWTYFIVLYGLSVGAGLLSFALNRRRFSLGRFATFLLVSLLWGLCLWEVPMFALVLAATLTLNGQEWYQDMFGTEGRIGRGWSFWSSGGRLVTLSALFLCVAIALTGYGRSSDDAHFGFGANTDELAFEAGDFLRTAPIRGRILNTTASQGDALIWRDYGQRQTFVDSRSGVFPPEFQEELHQLRLALKDDVVERWKPVLDRYEISGIMIDDVERTHRNTYRRLSQSLNWIPFYDDGNVVMFGRADAPAVDLAYFKANRLDPDLLAYRVTKPLPPAEGPPSTITRLDTIFQNRFLESTQPHSLAARRWLEARLGDDENPEPPDPARCLLAIKEARLALARKPNDSVAYRVLSEAYGALLNLESALLAGLTLSAKDREQASHIMARPQVVMNRYRQRATALNFAIMTTPPPTDPAGRLALIHLNLELHQLYLTLNFVDLARDRLKAALALNEPGDLKPDVVTEFTTRSAKLEDQVRQVQDAMNELVAEQQASTLQKANLALQYGAPGLAIQELEEALQVSQSPQVKPKLLDLYCDTGQPDKALDLLSGSADINDPSLGAEAGVAALRQGRVYFLLGNYEYAATLWEKYAIPQIRFERSDKILRAARALLIGDGKTTTATFLEVPGKIATQAIWENDLAMCRLEGGQPVLAAEQFTKALTLAPDLPTRPVGAYYLEKLGRAVPPTSKEAEKEADKKKNDAFQDKAKPEKRLDKPKDGEAEKPAEKPKSDVPAEKPKSEKS